MAEPRFWHSRTALTGLALLPLSAVYGGLEYIRRRFAQPQHPGKPVICVGNLTAGGAGKTPTVRRLMQWLTEDGHAPAVLSRGYGGSEKGPLRVDPSSHQAAQTGDEPLMLAKDWPVYICADRAASLRLAVADGHDVLVKDDGFQNPTMMHHFNLIVVDGTGGIGNGRLLPAGPLRQPLSAALARLDALLVIGEPTHASLPPLLDKVQEQKKPIFYGSTDIVPNDALVSQRVHGFCGIAKPEKFRASLKANGCDIVAFTAFGDHHPFSEADAQKILASDVVLVTTEKDMARLNGAPPGSARAQLAARAAVLEIDLLIEKQDDLRRLIAKALADKQANQTYQTY